MMATGRQRRARRRRTANAHVRKQAELWAAEQPHLQNLQHGIDRYLSYTRASSSAADAVAKVRADVRTAADAIIERAQGHGLIDVVQGARASAHLYAAVHETEVSAAALELVALTLACRDAQPGPAPEIESIPENPYLPPHIYAAAQEALATGSMVPLFDADPSDPFAQIAYFSVQREIAMRNPVYPHMLLDSLRELFNDPEVATDCMHTFGFTGLQAVEVMEAVRVLAIQRLAVRFDRLLEARDATVPILETHRSNADHPSSHSESATPPDPAAVAVMTEMFEALQDITTSVAQAAIIDLEAVSEQAGVESETAQAVLSAFTLEATSDLDGALERFFRGDNPLRTAPIVADAEGRLMLVHDGLALPAVREVLETGLKAAGRLTAYERYRGRWVEKAALDLLEGALPGAEIYRSFDYFIPDPTADVPQMRPADYTKRVEADGLILLDDVAFIIEVKAVALTAEARGGVVRRLRGKLRDIITKAVDQATRLRERIIEDRQLRLGDGRMIELSGVREIHTIAVGLEDLSGVSTATAILVHSGVLTSGHIPWTVSLHDLRIICELVDRPSEFLVYMRRRTHPETTLKFLAVDELDLYMHFLYHGLYVEPDPRQIADNLPWTGQPTEAALLRRANQRRELIDSMTEPLDAWYQSQLDPTAPPADKPRMPGTPEFLKLVDEVTATSAPGWLSTTAILLEGSTSARHKLGRYARDLGRLVKQDDRHHSATQLLVDTHGSSFVLAWVCLGRNESPEQRVKALSRYLGAKKHQVKAPRAAIMLFDSSGRELLQLQFDDREPGPDSVLDAAAARLLPPTASRRVPTRSATARKKRRRR